MSQQSAVPKPSLQGVRTKVRKGQVKAQAKHEPAVFRDQLYKHLETVPENDFEGFSAKLVQAGGTLEYLKYADALFEILLVGGLIQPGGSYLDDGAPMSPFSIFNARNPPDIEELKKYVDVFNKLNRSTSVRWSSEQRDKLAMTLGLLLSQGLVTAACLQSLTKDHLIKNDQSINILALIFSAYLTDQSIDHLAATLKRGNIKDLLLFFPPNKRDAKVLDAFFREKNLPTVADWYTKKQYAIAKDAIMKELKEVVERSDDSESIISAIQSKLEEQRLPEAELIQSIWQGLMASVDWSARPDQIEGLALREVGKFAPVLVAFCKGPKTQVALINIVQVYCYDDTRVMKAFPQILKVLYNKDCVSDQAIIYWHQKGSKPQGRQHFLKATEGLVKVCQQISPSVLSCTKLVL
ncbi:armadillo-type protein [Suillus fuscotomentosus]|uniref:Armadillo-type protein n=1 Tax=Suillus fuscotomentosus TaxID=1912939 RepID=A0AAD4HL79_9AGAM|nr:armadillo-type protein [Suillus fuscotomentosus]KAG1900582.1 armadillo-type protein [Suillus fuscotomentosus]